MLRPDEWGQMPICTSFNVTTMDSRQKDTLGRQASGYNDYKSQGDYKSQESIKLIRQDVGMDL